MTSRPVRAKRKIHFPPRKMPLIQKDDPEDTLDEAIRYKARIVELSDDEDEFEDVEDEGEELEGIPFPGKPFKRTFKRAQNEHALPLWLQATTLNLFHDDLETTSSQVQGKVTKECLPLLTGQDSQGLSLNTYGIPRLQRQQHARFLHTQLEKLSAPYQMIDASRPWLFYWSLAGLSTLGEDVSHYRERLMETVRPLQNPGGGFGGGHGQLSHCACSYATVLALTVVEGLEVVDRKAMWQWLGSVKQPDGGFCMAIGAEEDIRGAYCAMTIINLLNLPLELPRNAPTRQAGMTSFLDRLGEWVGRCQTYEGGIAGAPTNEAHGAYAFCALACLSNMDAPQISIPKYLDGHALVSWLATRQTQSEGGFQGRQEKLVDACYSHWVGGCWGLIQAALPTINDEKLDGKHNGRFDGGADVWNRSALILYLLTCCQQPGKKGGMRDKPSSRPDAYHTCYSLAGLSHAQNHYHYNASLATRDEQTGRILAAFNWTAEGPTKDELKEWKVDRGDVVDLVHPVFVVPMSAAEKAKEMFKGCGV